jgi:hypothetical protein
MLIVAILFMLFGLLAPKLSFYLAFQLFCLKSIPDETYSRNVQDWISTFFLIAFMLLNSYLKSSSKEFIFDFQEVSFTLFTDERFIYDLESCIILNILPTSVTMTTSN